MGTTGERILDSFNTARFSPLLVLVGRRGAEVEFEPRRARERPIGDESDLHPAPTLPGSLPNELLDQGHVLPTLRAPVAFLPRTVSGGTVGLERRTGVEPEGERAIDRPRVGRPVLSRPEPGSNQHLNDAEIRILVRAVGAEDVVIG